MRVFTPKAQLILIRGTDRSYLSLMKSYRGIVMEIILDGEHLTIEDIHAVARLNATVKIAENAMKNIKKCRDFIEEMVASNKPIYGVTTGIGEFARIRVSPELGAQLQKNIVYSHAAGTGETLPVWDVRAAMLLRVNTLCRGNSGVRLSTIQTLVEMLNKSVTPFVFEKGSVGTSGDLSPLSQIAMVVIGEGEAFYKGERLPGAEAMERAAIEPVELSYKEGLGIINGSQMCTGQSALILYEAEHFMKNAIIASAMTIDVLRSVEKAFDARLHQARPYPGQIAVAENLRKLFQESEILADRTGKIQDGYSLRCTPQVLGPSLDALQYVRKQIEIEINSSADNPLFFPDSKTYLAGGNFHGQSIGMAMDFLCIALAEVADLSERHTNRMMNPVLSGLPDFLVKGKGVNSGLMVAQYTAAALVSENKVLAHPGVVDSISVSADQEDHVAMTPVSVRKCKEILKNVQVVIAIEMYSAAQAMDFRKPRKPGKGTAIAYDRIRELVSFLENDRPLYPDINIIADLVRNCSILDTVESKIGEIRLK